MKAPIRPSNRSRRRRVALVSRVVSWVARSPEVLELARKEYFRAYRKFVNQHEKAAAEVVVSRLRERGVTSTPDGIPITTRAISRAINLAFVHQKDIA